MCFNFNGSLILAVLPFLVNLFDFIGTVIQLYDLDLDFDLYRETLLAKNRERQKIRRNTQKYPSKNPYQIPQAKTLAPTGEKFTYIK